jgi:uncharacterized protein (TIGR00369 family)
MGGDRVIKEKLRALAGQWFGKQSDKKQRLLVLLGLAGVALIALTEFLPISGAKKTAATDGIEIPTLAVEQALEQRIAELAYETREWMKNPLGQVHGGMVGLLMDAGMGATVYSVYGFTAPSITMTLNYIRPVPADTRIHVRTRLVSCGKNTCHAIAEMMAEDQPDRVLVTATSVFHIGGKPMRT